MPVPATLPTDLRLVEIFSSFQGEGVFVGRRQLFVRLADCNLDCAYCDTPFHARPQWRCEIAPGSGAFSAIANPVTPEALTARIAAIVKQGPWHHSLALTGGEPLLQAEGLAAWLPEVSALLPLFLETNGTLPGHLAGLRRWLRWISMDLKLESSSGAETPWDVHGAFIDAAGTALCQVKAVVVAQTPEEELTRAAHLVAARCPEVPLILQPRTIDGRPVVTGGELLAMQAVAAAIHPPTLVIPQVHPLLAIP